MSLHKENFFLKSTIIVTAATTIAKLIGFAREILLAAFYGTGTVSDAFILAISIPETLLLMLSVSTASGCIAMYHKVKDKTKFVSNVMTLLLIIGLAFSAVFSLYPQALVRLFAFRINSETFELTVYFVRYMIWSSVFILLIGIYNALLEIKGSFFSAGIRSMWGNLVIIIGIILSALTGYKILIAISHLVGSALCILLLAIGCRKAGFVFRPYLNIHSPELKQLLSLSMPILMANAVFEVHLIISRNFAAILPTGSISLLNYAGKIQNLFVALLGQTLLTVLFPHMSKLVADGNIKSLKTTLSRGIMCVFAVTLPVCIGVVVLAQPIVRIILNRGSFTIESTIGTASCLRIYAILIVAASINMLLQRAFYAIQSPKIPANISIIAIIINVLLNFLFVKPLGVEGLALSSVFANIVVTILLMIFIRKKIGQIWLPGNLLEFTKIILSATAMGIGVWFAASVLPLMSVSAWQCALLCIASATVAALVYVGLLLLMRSEIAFEVAVMIIKFTESKRKSML